MPLSSREGLTICAVRDPLVLRIGIAENDRSSIPTVPFVQGTVEGSAVPRLPTAYRWTRSSLGGTVRGWRGCPDDKPRGSAPSIWTCEEISRRYADALLNSRGRRRTVGLDCDAAAVTFGFASAAAYIS